MITITQDDGVATLINVFNCEPKNQQHLIAAWIRATEETLRQASGHHLSHPTSEQGQNACSQLRAMESSENWENLFRIGSKSWFNEMAKYAKPDPSPL